MRRRLGLHQTFAGSARDVLWFAGVSVVSSATLAGFSLLPLLAVLGLLRWIVG